MTAAYCPSCLDAYNVQPSRYERGDWMHVSAGITMHVACGLALEALRKTPATYEFGDEPEWAA